MKIRLELDDLRIDLKRQKWNLYFVVATEDPDDSAKSLVTVLPERTVVIRKMSDNYHDFEGTGEGDPNGMFVLERPMPTDRSVKVRIWVVQSRKKLRASGEILQDITTTINSEGIATEVLSVALGATTPWIAVATAVLNVGSFIGKMLKKAKDKEMGMASLDEGFNDQEVADGHLLRTKSISGFGEFNLTWIIDD